MLDKIMQPTASTQPGGVFRDLTTAQLVEHAVRRDEGVLTLNGALSVSTGRFTGRSPQDKYFVADPAVQQDIDWNANQPLSPEHWHKLHQHITEHLVQKNCYLQHLAAGMTNSLPVRVITEYAWHSLFIQQLLPHSQPTDASDLQHPLYEPYDGFTILCAPSCRAVPEVHGTHSETFIVIHLAGKIAVIGGTEYAGEIKKAVFSIMNYLLPKQNVFPMHCSATTSQYLKETALFFGLSGTGKTTLSADPHRVLIGDDEHAWSEEGVYNIEAGCYAKCIHLSEEKEPWIFNAIRFGSVLENVPVNYDTRIPDYESSLLTENTRAAYPLQFIPNHTRTALAPHPRNIVFLTADAFGVLPAISRLTHEQALYYFLNGYTAKVAGTERGLSAEPQATFSTCFARPFLPLPPQAYSSMLKQRLQQYSPQVWLINTGWYGGAYGTGERIPLTYTRNMLNAALDGMLQDAEYVMHPVFRLQYPKRIAGIPENILAPHKCWKSEQEYYAQANKLGLLFHDNFQKNHPYASHLLQAGPALP